VIKLVDLKPWWEAVQQLVDDDVPRGENGRFAGGARP
jgi:hypothetical protein